MKNKIVKIPLMILAGAACISAGAYLTMLLWNALLPNLFHFPVITFWQALGLLILSKIFFGGFHHGHGRRHGCCGSRKHRRDFDKLTPEEKEKIMQRMAEDDCCGPWSKHAWHHSSECCEDKKDSEEK